MNIEKTEQFFDNLADQWDQMTKQNFRSIKTILNISGLKKELNILDIATGTGVLIPFLEKFKPEHITAIDVSKKMIERAVVKYKDKYNNIDFIYGNFYEFEEKNFDYAICYRAYPHFTDKELFAKHLSSCLKLGGRFVIAHSESKEVINNRHNSNHTSSEAKNLESALKEEEYFKPYFDIDIVIDTEDFYVISGIKKE